MEETLASQKMAEIDLINNLEKISSEIPNRILKLEGFILKENQKEQLEILIFKGFSSSTTHPIEIDLEKKFITFSYINSAACAIWLQPSSNLYIIIKNLFNFFFGANFTQPISKFLGLFSLLIYILGLIQWSIIKLPKNGRNSCFSENGKN